MDSINIIIIIISFLLFLSIPIAYLWITSTNKRSSKRRSSSNDDDDNPEVQVFGFFHPYCSGGGGGERVLWKMIQIIQKQYNKKNKKSTIVIYTIDPPTTDEFKLRQDVNRRFDVEILQPIQLISLEEYKDYLNPSPYLSLILESIGTMKLAYRALQKYKPDVYVDTTGCAFTFLIAKYMMINKIMAYVHYPTISTDMMLWEWKQQKQNNNNRSLLKTILKLIYYWIFAILYGIVGSLADLVMVNSTWTYNHISSLWRLTKEIHIVYPPCRVPTDTTTTQTTTDQKQQTKLKRQNNIVSIGQFRPEKDHTLQIQSLAKLFELYPQHKVDGNNVVKLILIGSCRNDDDQRRVDTLKELVNKLNLQEYVIFNINPPYQELQQSMYISSIGLHTMRQEHFGIGIVEMMAAGLITIAHNSGGPKSDIITNGKTGFLATSVDEYANCIHQALIMSSKEQQLMRQNAQISATRFSDHVFDETFGNQILPILFGAATKQK